MCEQREELGSVLCETAITGLYMAELTIDRLERVLDLGLHFGDNAIDLIVD